MKTNAQVNLADDMSINKVEKVNLEPPLASGLDSQPGMFQTKCVPTPM